MKDHALSLSCCWPSPSWDSIRLGQGQSRCPGGSPSSQLKKDKLDPLHGQTSLFLHKRKISVTLRQAFVSCWYGLHAAARRRHGLGGFGLELPIAAGTRPLTALPGGALQTLVSEVRGPLVRVFLLPASWGLQATTLPQMRALGVFDCVLLESFKPVAWNTLDSRRTTFASSEPASHIPGVCNRRPDYLSWMWASAAPSLPQRLERVPQQQAPDRDRWFWLLTLRVVGSSQPPDRPHCMPPWVHILPVRPGEVRPL